VFGSDALLLLKAEQGPKTSSSTEEGREDGSATIHENDAKGGGTRIDSLLAAVKRMLPSKREEKDTPAGPPPAGVSGSEEEKRDVAVPKRKKNAWLIGSVAVLMLLAWRMNGGVHKNTGTHPDAAAGVPPSSMEAKKDGTGKGDKTKIDIRLKRGSPKVKKSSLPVGGEPAATQKNTLLAKRKQQLGTLLYGKKILPSIMEKTPRLVIGKESFAPGSDFGQLFKIGSISFYQKVPGAFRGIRMRGTILDRQTGSVVKRYDIPLSARYRAKYYDEGLKILEKTGGEKTDIILPGQAIGGNIRLVRVDHGKDHQVFHLDLGGSEATIRVNYDKVE